MSASIFQRINVTVGSTAGLPAFDHDAFCNSLATLVGKRYSPLLFMDAAKAPLSGATVIKNRGGPSTCYAASTASKSPTVSASDGAMNNQASMDFSPLTDSSDLQVYGAAMSASFSVVAAITRPPTSLAGHLCGWQLTTGNAYPHKIRTNTSGNLYYDNVGNESGANTNTLLNANLPAPGTKFILALSYDDATKTSSFSINGGTPQTYVHPNNVTANSALKFNIGGVGGAATSLGWEAKIGRMLVWNRAMHIAPTTKIWNDVQTLMKSTYAIT